MPDDLEPAEPIVPRDSSTVIVLREAAALEVFMLERHIKSDFAGGAYVFAILRSRGSSTDARRSPRARVKTPISSARSRCARSEKRSKKPGSC